ncbi:hypothetical protein [Geodermatophilus sp. CPCC 205761]|uniref:hypothetical protein n=1 Tax=Geodermatophilus sp. CPCC 205761 TaxID=2936597 RepID=UPI003EE884E6
MHSTLTSPLTRGTRVGRWNVFFHTTTVPAARQDSPIAASTINEALARRSERAIPAGRPFLVGPDGHPDSIINDFFTRGRGRTRRLTGKSPRTYAYCLSGYLNLLHQWGLSWREVDSEDIDAVYTWRVLDTEQNEDYVQDATWQKDSAVFRALYGYASRFGIDNPLPDVDDDLHDTGGAYVRSSDVKWFDPQGYAMWRDVGLGGHLPDGTPDSTFRAGNVQRDMAFSDALYRTGLRVQEAGSVLLGAEWPNARDHARPWHTLHLAKFCAKRQRGRTYWVPASVVSDTYAYVIGERAQVVSAGQAKYQAMDGKAIVLRQLGDDLIVREPSGKVAQRPLDDLSPQDRQRLFWRRRTDQGDVYLEPAMLWLNRDGTPRPIERWNSTFARANARIDLLGYPMAKLTPHRLRHSFALRWFVVARLLWDQRMSFLTAEEAQDLRAEMGSHWKLVQTLLGHRHTSTTQNIYLEPFQTLDIEMLLDHAADESVTDLMAALLRGHARVQTVAAG